MSSSEYPNSENRNTANPSANGADVSHHRLHQFANCLLPTRHQTMPSSHSSAASFSLDQLDNAEHQPSAAQNCSMLHSQIHPSHSGCGEMPSSCDNGYRQGFPSSACKGLSSNFRTDDSFQFSSQTGIPEVTACPVNSLEMLLDFLSVFQQKIQQLQAVLRLMAHGTATISQQQQAVAAGVASMISELMKASACLTQRSPSGSAQSSASYLQLNSITGGTPMSGINSFQQDGTGNPLSALLGNFVGSTFEDIGAPTGWCSAYGMGPGSTLRDDIGSSDMDRNWGENGPILPPHDSANSLAPIVENSNGNTIEINVGAKACPDRAFGVTGNHEMDGLVPSEDHDIGRGLKDEDDDDDESLPPGSYEMIEMDAAEILAEHTHFCEICGKGFKRDANLRMHMRGHGDEYKSPAALARPDKSTHAFSTVRPRRYSCPSVGCKRNKKHRKFQPLKTMLCVKNHYRRSHCLKMLTCNKCKIKKFSVAADLKTHEKHCGRDKWQCSCGTTFSRKDKLLGHVGLFAGHVPALSLCELEIPAAGLEMSASFNSGHGEGWQCLLPNEAAQLGVPQFNLVQANESATDPALIVGSNQSMGTESAIGVGAVRS